MVNNKKTKKKRGKGGKQKGGNRLANIGSAIGGVFGLRDLGREAGKLVSRLTGFGEYRLNQNSIMQGSTGVPIFRDTNDTVIIEHKEFLMDLKSSIGFQAIDLLVNPGDKITFPWLSQVASAYSQYEFMGLVFSFRTTSGNAVASNNTTLGTVVMMSNPDASAGVPSSKREMESYQFCTSGPPSESLLHPVECNPSLDAMNLRWVEPLTYNRSTGVAMNLYDLGRFTIATEGQQVDDATLGELWVTYKVKLVKPRGTPAGYPLTYSHWNNVGLVTAINGAGPFKDINLLSDSTVPEGFGYPSVERTGPTAFTQISFYGCPPNTVYHIEGRYRASTGGFTSPPLSSITASLHVTPLAFNFFNAYSGTSTTSTSPFVGSEVNSSQRYVSSCYVMTDSNTTNPAFKPYVRFANIGLNGGGYADIEVVITSIPHPSVLEIVNLTQEQQVSMLVSRHLNLLAGSDYQFCETSSVPEEPPAGGALSLRYRNSHPRVV